MLGHLNDDVDRSQNRLEAAQKQMAKFLRETRSRWLCYYPLWHITELGTDRFPGNKSSCCILILIIVLCVLLVIAFVI